ncbi:MAG: ISL3 family transposase, partial [Chloroflexota bacterium]
MRDDCITIALGLPEVGVVREEETETEITVEIRYRAEGAPCPRCGQWTPKVHSVRSQRKRDRRLWD